MAVRDSKHNLTTQEFTVDLYLLSRSRVRTALHKLGNLLKFGWLRGSTKNLNSSNYDVDKARELQLANYDNVATMAQVYNKRF